MKSRCLIVLVLLCPACVPKQVAEVTGVVKLDGEPLPDVIVSFVPDPDGLRSTGVTDAEGKFTLRFDTAGDGAVVGLNRVLVQDRRALPAPRNRRTQEEPAPPPPSRVASKYEKANTTPLRQELKHGKNSIIIEVTRE